MKLKEFIAAIPVEVDGRRWVFWAGGEIRISDIHIRVRLRCQCPISSLLDEPASEYQRVGERYGLTPAQIMEIVRAADCRGSDLGWKAAVIRAAILKHVGLQEKESK